MKNQIERTLFWFSDGNEQILSLNTQFFPLSNLLNRLLCERYNGKKIKFINIYFRTEKSYQLHPQSKKHNLHYYGGYLKYDDIIDLSEFNETFDKDKFIWKRAWEILRESAQLIKNYNLLDACNDAYNQGLIIGLNPDYRMLEKDFTINETVIKVSLWVNFKKNNMYSTLTLEKDNVIFFQKEIDKTQNGNEFFLEMYKSIDMVKNMIIIKGHRDVSYLPLKIEISPTTFDVPK